MSENKPKEKTIEVFADASEYRNISTVAVAHVIKDGSEPPLIGSSIYNGGKPFVIETQNEKDDQKTHLVKYPDLHNSYGEIVAILGGLDTLACYCESNGIDTKNVRVDVKTDFSYLKTLLNDSINVNDADAVNGKRTLLIELKKVKDQFKDVRCELIEGNTNIAHRICDLAMQTYIENKIKEYLDSLYDAESETPKKKVNFYEIYEDPGLCIPQ